MLSSSPTTVNTGVNVSCCSCYYLVLLGVRSLYVQKNAELQRWVEKE